MNLLYGHTYNHIPLGRPALGHLFQSQTPAEWIRRLPGPLVICSLQPLFHAGQWIDRVNVFGVLEVPFKDLEGECLADSLYLGTVMACVGYLRAGVNVLVHCQAGISRSSYVTCGILMVVNGWQAARALEHLRAHREGAEPNAGFFQHVKELEPRLLELHRSLAWEWGDVDTERENAVLA